MINHIDQDLPYHDSLKYHFGRITSTWKPQINSEVFEALKSDDLNLITNDDLRDKLVSYYSWSTIVLDEQIDQYVQRIENANSTMFSTRFNALWNGDYSKYQITENFEDLKIEMIPNNYHELKNDTEFLYFLRSLKNQFYWDIEVPQNDLKEKINDLTRSIESELEKRNYK